MSENKDIDAALKAAGAPDYMVLIINEIMGAKDAIRGMMSELSALSVELRQREQVIADREQMLEDRQQAFVDAAKDMQEFATRIYGPDSELTKINAKLGSIEMAAANRDQRYAERFRVIDENQTLLKNSIDERFTEVHVRYDRLEGRVGDLEKEKKTG